MMNYFPTWNLYELSASPINTFPLSCWGIDFNSITSRDPSSSSLQGTKFQELGLEGYIKFNDGEERLFCSDFALHLGHVSVSISEGEAISEEEEKEAEEVGERRGSAEGEIRKEKREKKKKKNASLVYRLIRFPIGLNYFFQELETAVEYKLTL
jgi:hypothetical protein